MTNTLMAFQLKHQDGSIRFCEITDIHAMVFGVHEQLIPQLNRAYCRVRNIEQQEGASLSDHDRVESMCLDTVTKDLHLPFNQCFRWHMLLSVLAELSWMEAQFGNGLTDKFDRCIARKWSIQSTNSDN